MSAEIYDDNPAVVAPANTYVADGEVLFGKLVMVGTAAGEAKVTTGITVGVLGMAVADEKLGVTNAADKYVDSDVMSVMALMPGKILKLYANGGITRGDYVSASTAGDVATIVPASGTSYQIIGIALEDITTDTRGRVLIL